MAKRKRNPEIELPGVICAAVAAYYGRAFGRITPEQAREVATHAQVCAHEVAQIVRGEVAKP